MQFLLEICADSVRSASIAQETGAGRIELCDSLIEGGVTPSPGKIESARSNIDIPVNVLIRPRAGDFLYSTAEYEIMRRDIAFCGEAGINGIVIGILTEEGFIDTERTAKLCEEARPMSITFHRAFDLCNDPVRGLKDIISTGADRLLTSGQKNSAPEGSDMISRLVGIGGKNIIIMPGGGINVSNIKDLALKTGAHEFHLTGRKTIDSGMKFRLNGVKMGGLPEISEYQQKVADPEIISNIVSILKLI